MEKIASLISKILNPVLFAALSVVVVVVNSDISDQEKLLWLLAALVAIVVPFIFLRSRFKGGQIKDLWSPSAQERASSLLVWVISAGLFSTLAYFFTAPRLILALSLAFLALGLLNLVAGSYLKLSIHCEAVTVFVLTAMLTSSVLYILLAILIPVVAWSRVYLKAHTLSEVSFGTLAALLAVYFVFNYFGLVTF